jgi:hypothetical protein
MTNWVIENMSGSIAPVHKCGIGIQMKRVFEAPLYTGAKGQQYVKASELTKADIAKIQKCIKVFV